MYFKCKFFGYSSDLLYVFRVYLGKYVNFIGYCLIKFNNLEFKS